MMNRIASDKAIECLLREGDLAIDLLTGSPVIVRDDDVQAQKRHCEVFGFFHECASINAKYLRPITREEFDYLREVIACGERG